MRIGMIGMAVAVQTASAGLSVPVRVDSDLRSAHWTTVFTNAVALAWDWNTNASRARLDIIGMGGTFTTNFTEVTSNYLWRIFATDVPEAEDVYDLTLTFYTNGNLIAESRTSRLAVVTGAFGAAAVDAVDAGRTWQKVKKDVVIPYNAAFSEAATNALSAQLVIAKEGGAVETNAFPGVAGFYGWKIRNNGWGYGTFDLELTFLGTTNKWTAELTRPLDGTAVGLR